MQHAQPTPRRRALGHLAAVASGLAAAVGLGAFRSADAQQEQFAVSGGGVNVKEMPAADGTGMVPLRESFSFDAHYAQCIVEDNPAAFAMDTFGMGRVVVEAHQFFMAMHSDEMSVVSVKRTADGRRVARLTGRLGCATYAGTASLAVGSREAMEPAFFEIEATDGGHGGGAAGDSFIFTVYFDLRQAPVNHGIFGPKADFTGQMVAGEVTIAAPVTRPLIDST